MYAQLTFSGIPGVGEKSVLDLLLPFLKSMKYEALLVMTTKDHSRIHVILRYHEPGRKDHLVERFARNVYSKFTLPPGKKATDYVSIGHKMKESDYVNVAEVLFNDQWGPAPGVETIEDLEKQLLELKPYLDRAQRIKQRIHDMRLEESRKSKPQHTHEPTKALIDGCPVCERMKRSNPFLKGERSLFR
jgi:hypothetical protein